MPRTSDHARLDADGRKVFAETLAKIFGTLRGADVTEELKAFGIREMLAEDPYFTIPLVFEQQGRAAATSRILQELLLVFLGEYFMSRSDIDPGNVILSPTALDGVCAIKTNDHNFSVKGLVVGGLESDQPILAAGLVDGQLSLVAFDTSSSDLSLCAVGGLDPMLKCVSVRGDAATAMAVIRSVEAGWAWQSAVDWSRIALAHEIVGATGYLLSLAAEYAQGRQQFGRPIGSFQAVKHKLAEVRIALSAAKAAAQAAAEEPSTLSSLVAKSMSGRAGRIAATNCLQTFGGIGFTWEHDYHRYMKRIVLLDQLLGSATNLPSLIGEHVLASGTVPRLVEL